MFRLTPLTTLAHPDPGRTQFEIVREFVRRHQADGIWYDYSCMPQEPHSSADQQLFADSLRHMNSLIVTTNFLSIESDDYFSRAWCYYERIIWDSKQVKPDSIRIVRIRKYPDVSGYAFVIRVLED